jgi:hypothetical protein
LGTARRLFRSRLGISRVLRSSFRSRSLSSLTFSSAIGDPAFDSFGDALIWAVTTVLALQGDPVPASIGGRIAMLAGFSSASWLSLRSPGHRRLPHEERRERAERDEPTPP